MKKLILICTICTLAFFTLQSDSCTTTPTADQSDQRKQEILQRESSAQIGMPNLTNFTEKKIVKMLYELRDNPNLINYAYIQSEYTGKLVYLGKCVGYGIPYATQFSNPQRVAGYTETPEHGNLALPQAEPNGLFMPSSAEGTWIMLIDPSDNKPKPVYIEPKVTVSPFKLEL